VNLLKIFNNYFIFVSFDYNIKIRKIIQQSVILTKNLNVGAGSPEFKKKDIKKADKTIDKG